VSGEHERPSPRADASGRAKNDRTEVPAASATTASSDDALLPARVPPLPLWSFRAAFTLVVTAYVVIVYIAVRAMQGNFGASPTYVLFAIVPVVILGVFLLPLVPFAELPENWVLQQLPASRRRRGLCPSCAYPMSADAPRCPECGSDGRVRPLVEPSWSALRRFAPMALFGLVLGVAIGETLVQVDERRFRAEVAAMSAPVPGTTAADVSRPRQWPGSFATLRWSHERGFEADAPGLGAKR